MTTLALGDSNTHIIVTVAESGGTYTSNIAGGLIAPSMSLWCVFGDVKVMGQAIDYQRILCTPPPVLLSDMLSTTTIIRVAISLDGIAVGASSPFVITSPVSQGEIIPSIGSILGNTPIQIILPSVQNVGTGLVAGGLAGGSGFSQMVPYVCLFGILPVPAMFISSSQLSCVSPPGR